jgi:hypothetical protein
MSFIDGKYYYAANSISDINEHIPTLYEYAKNCEVIAEMGVRGVVSTWAFLKGLNDNKSDTKKLTCVDIEDIDMTEAIRAGADAGIDVNFLKENSATVNFGYPIDLLFIDTWHNYGHLKRELEFHNSNVKKYIIMHDTTTFGTYGENLRLLKEEAIKRAVTEMQMGKNDLSVIVNSVVEEVLIRGGDSNICKLTEKSGYSYSDVMRGLNQAVSEFLVNHPEWRTKVIFTNNNGLTVLERIL